MSSRSRITASYWRLERRGICDVAGIPGMQFELMLALPPSPPAVVAPAVGTLLVPPTPTPAPAESEPPEPGAIAEPPLPGPFPFPIGGSEGGAPASSPLHAARTTDITARAAKHRSFVIA